MEEVEAGKKEKEEVEEKKEKEKKRTQHKHKAQEIALRESLLADDKVTSSDYTRIYYFL